KKIIKENIKEITTGTNARAREENNLPGAAIKFYDENFELITPHVSQLIGTYLDDGLTEGLIVRVMQDAIENKAKNLKYVKKILNRCYEQGITTAEAFELDQKNFQEKRARGQPAETPKERIRRIRESGG
ncbi:MAG: DnaD domain protein, partial [Halanaerobiales bacterium]|nr:DnaD domain protein [Halanaerobiales bacterium]